MLFVGVVPWDFACVADHASRNQFIGFAGKINARAKINVAIKQKAWGSETPQTKKAIIAMKTL
jgi:hypothetical protein